MKRPIERQKTSWLCPVFLAMSVAIGACRPAPCDDEVKEGERFQITIIDQVAPASSCGPTLPVLAAGDIFTLVAGLSVMETLQGGDGESGTCDTRGARADAVPFLSAALTSCATSEHRLGLTCTGADASGCGLSVTAQVNQIPSGAAATDHAAYFMTWTSDCGIGPCVQQYDVRIERVEPIPGG
jgi:hypothetical protein